MARDGRRRLRRVPGGAAGLGVDVARRARTGRRRRRRRRAWRSRWESEAAAFGTPGMPATFEDAPNAGQPILDAQAAAEAGVDGGAWRGSGASSCRGWCGRRSIEAGGRPTAVAPPGRRPARAARWRRPPSWRCRRPTSAGSRSRRGRSRRSIRAPAHAILVAAALDGARVVGAVAGSSLVGVAVADGAGELLALGVAPAFRRRGLGAALLRFLVDGRPDGGGMTAEVGVAERDWVEPLDVETRRDVARRLLTGAGFELARRLPGRRPRRSVGDQRAPGDRLTPVARRRADRRISASRAPARRT